MYKTKLKLLYPISLLLIFLSCNNNSSNTFDVVLTRNKLKQNYFEGNFSIENQKYYLSIWDRNKNNYFQDKDVDIATIRNETNKLFIADTLAKLHSVEINNTPYSFQQINDSLVKIKLQSDMRSDNISQFVINDTMANINLHYFNKDSTSPLFDIIENARCDSILIYIWETQCPPCLSDIDKFSKIETNNLKIIHLCFSRDADDASELMSKKSYKPFFDGYILESERSKVYCIGFPTKYFINKNKYITKYLF